MVGKGMTPHRRSPSSILQYGFFQFRPAEGWGWKRRDRLATTKKEGSITYYLPTSCACLYILRTLTQPISMLTLRDVDVAENHNIKSCQLKIVCAWRHNISFSIAMLSAYWVCFPVPVANGNSETEKNCRLGLPLNQNYGSIFNRESETMLSGIQELRNRRTVGWW